MLVALHLTGCTTIGAVAVDPRREQTGAQIARDRAACEAEARAEIESGLAEFFKTKVGFTIGGAVLGLAAGLSMVANTSTSDPRQPLVLIAAAGAVGGAIGFVAGDVVGVKKGLETARRSRRTADATYRECMRKRGYELSG